MIKKILIAIIIVLSLIIAIFFASPSKKKRTIQTEQIEKPVEKREEPEVLSPEGEQDIEQQRTDSQEEILVY